MNASPELQVIVAAAEHFGPHDGAKCATPELTSQVSSSDFDKRQTQRLTDLVRANAPESDLGLLDNYMSGKLCPVSLRRIGKILRWIKPLKGNKDIRELRESGMYERFLYFTTPAIAASGATAFLEVHTEDGAFSHMGSWYYVLAQKLDDDWGIWWSHLHKMS